jgi:serine/threonine-protein kinase
MSPESPAQNDPTLELPAIGEVLGGMYRITEQLGEGGMGLVFKAHDQQLDRHVAIKFVRPEFAKSTTVRDQFTSEARAMARVHHTNVVAIHTFGDYGGTPYFVMEYIPGMTLSDWLEDRGALSIDESLGVLKQICQGVQAIHDAGAVHYDIKPSNVLIGPGFRVAVADLGLVRMVGGPMAGATGSLAGTLSYLSPEVALMEPVEKDLAPRADVYSLGILAFELLTGRLPFDAPSSVEMLRLHVEAEPPAASEIRPELPDAFEPVLRRALAKDPARRMSSAKIFCNSLAGIRDLLRSRH